MYSQCKKLAGVIWEKGGRAAGDIERIEFNILSKFTHDINQLLDCIYSLPLCFFSFFSTDISVWQVLANVKFLAWGLMATSRLRASASHGDIIQSRGWLPKVEALGYPRHPTSTKWCSCLTQLNRCTRKFKIKIKDAVVYWCIKMYWLGFLFKI